MRFANPFVFILQFCLIQLYPASNGDTGWPSINGTALILNKRVLHVLGLLNGISLRKTTSAHLDTVEEVIAESASDVAETKRRGNARKALLDIFAEMARLGQWSKCS
ncbi:hypothetical protein MRX96_044485 [Rhipicephalus microplus]